MENKPNSFISSGLIAILGIVALVIGLIVMLSIPGIRYAAWIIIALGIILLAIGFIIDYRQISSAITGRRGKFGMGATVMASIFIGITLIINAISIDNYHRFDLTGVAQFTLSAQTKEVLSDLETPIHTIYFYTPEDPYGFGGYITNLLTEYQNYTDQITIDIIDPDEHPDQAREYGIKQYQTVIFESEDKRRLVPPEEIIVQTGEQGEQVSLEAEHAFTSAILEITGAVQKKIYFLIGHNENSINSDYSKVREGLLDDLYKVATLNLTTNPAIPDDCAALIIAAPKESFTSNEADIIEHYLKAGGQTLILINPSFPQDISQLVSSWGVTIEDGTIIDPSSYISPNKDMPRVAADKSAFGLPATYFPGAVAIIPQEEAESPDTIEMLPLVWTSKDSWLERELIPTEEPEFNDGIDLKGPLSIGVLIAASPTEGEITSTSKLTRLIIIGDSDFASNEHYESGNNSDLFLNSITWLTEETELISIHHKVLPFRRLTAGPQATNFINYSSIGLIPLIVLAIGGIVWWRRRQ
ncbi:MAG: GldG family protein [Dehalococcoidales bacterium]|nr:GldG family protein [Dehalococcoidales bacterium]